MAVDRGQLQNVSKPNHCKNCNAMQITEGQDGIINAYVAKAKVQTTTKCNVMQRIEHTGTKKGSAKTG